MFPVVEFQPPLEEWIFERRYKRFLCDVAKGDGSERRTVHCANSGSMKSCLIQGTPALISDSANLERKLRYTLEALSLDDGWACLNTQRANEALRRLMALRLQINNHSFLGAKLFNQDFSNGTFKSEAKYDEHTRFDGLLVTDSWKHWIEVKSVSLRTSAERIAFPDAVTSRGTKHLETLIESLRNPHTKATLIFAITRGSDIDPSALAHQFQIAHEIDEKYANAARDAQNAGVQFRALVLSINANILGIRAYLPITLNFD